MATAVQDQGGDSEAAGGARAATITSIKGFNQDLTCRGYQFAIGGTYTHEGPVRLCESGFHACTVDVHPLSVFSYYSPAGSRYCQVQQAGETGSDGAVNIVSTIITVGVELSVADIVDRAWDYVWSRSIKSADAHVRVERRAASATGEQGAAAATGEQGAAMSSGYNGKVMGADGNALFAVERDDDYSIVSVAAGIVGRDGIEADIWYVARDSKLVRL